jgi:hypothetical protein
MAGKPNLCRDRHFALRLAISFISFMNGSAVGASAKRGVLQKAMVLYRLRDKAALAKRRQ